MKRSAWKFEYSAAQVADGAAAQAEFRRGRLAVWEQQRAKIMAEVKDSGIEVSESVAASLSNYAGTEMMGPRVSIRGDLQRKLTECHQKIEAHRAAASEYDGWVQVLRSNPEHRLKLTHDDWLYFFGKRA